MNRAYNRIKGFSLIEILAVIAILGVLSMITIGSLSKHVLHYKLERTTSNVASILEKAHHRARNAYNGVKHSVRIEASQAILFEGTSYSSSDPDNEAVAYDAGIELGAFSINGGGSIITFDKVTGGTSNHGSIRFQISSASTSSSTIMIGETGIIQVR